MTQKMLVEVNCEKPNARAKMGALCLKALDSEGEFEGLLRNLNGNQIFAGFPDLIVLDTVEQKPTMAIEKKRRSLIELTFLQALWLNWFQEHGVPALVYFGDDKKAVCLKNPAGKFSFQLGSESPLRIIFEEPKKELVVQRVHKARMAGERGRPMLSEGMRNAMIELRGRDWTYRAIAKELLVSEMTIWRHLRKYGG